MKHSNYITVLALAASVSLALLAGCAKTTVSARSDTDMDQRVLDIVQASFRDQGNAKLDRLAQDEANRACAAAEVSGKALDEAQAKVIEESSLKTIQWPSDGKFLGDWKEGEKIAQSGRGLTWTDAAGEANGGNCYNCHQISKEEISFGTLGPSLFNYGKMRGVVNPDAPESRPIVEYTWGKLWNARAYNACSQMPRVGHKGILNEQQIKHVMALLLDPKSPVNQ